MVLYRLTVLLLLVPMSSCTRNRNVILIGLSSVGYSDFESHDPQMRTPNIKALRECGVFFNQSYSLPSSQSTRAAWMTGKCEMWITYKETYRFDQFDKTTCRSLETRDNLRIESIVRYDHIDWINENIAFLPERFQELNYSTHLVGKWGLGYCHPCLTPLGRGFDTFYGNLLGYHKSQITHTRPMSNTPVYDWWDNDTVDYSARGTYSTDLFNARAVEVIKQSSPDKPFFLYLSYQMTHDPESVPQKYRDLCPDVLTGTTRHTRCATMAAIDKGVGDVVAALKEKHIYSNTVILLISDAGGKTSKGAMNYPLRGGKKGLYEGGIRSYTILRDSELTKTVWPGLVHAPDWYTILLGAANVGSYRPNPEVHGRILYNRIKLNKESIRKDFIIANDLEEFNHVMIRYKDMKLMKPLKSWKPWKVGDGKSGGWHEIFDNGTAVWKDVREKERTEPLLFNLKEDPFEQNPLPYETMKDGKIVQQMQRRLLEFLGGCDIKGKYPLKPLQNPVLYSTDNFENDVIKTGWCQPPGFPKDTDTCTKG